MRRMTRQALMACPTTDAPVRAVGKDGWLAKYQRYRGRVCRGRLEGIRNRSRLGALFGGWRCLPTASQSHPDQTEHHAEGTQVAFGHSGRGAAAARAMSN